MERGPAKSFRDLVVWQKAHRLVLDVYPNSAGFPKDETYGLRLQIRRAAVSVPANIAEWFKRLRAGDKVRFLNIAQSSLEEVRYFLILANDLRYLESANLMSQVEEVSKMLGAYVRAILNSGS